MGVRPSARHLGVAKAMLDEMEERVKHCGVDVIKFEVLSKNEKAKHLYLNQGYSIMTDLGIYQGKFSNLIKSDIAITESKIQTEPNETPWQNRSVFNQSFDVSLAHKKIGELVLDYVSGNDGSNSFIVRQFRVPTSPINKIYLVNRIALRVRFLLEMKTLLSF